MDRGGKLRRRIGRRRRIAGRVLIAAGALATAAWASSRWWSVEVWHGQDGAGFARGVFAYWFNQLARPAKPGLQVRTDAFSEPDRMWICSLTDRFPSSNPPSGGKQWECSLARCMSFPAPLGLTSGGVWLVVWPIPVALLGVGGLSLWCGRRVQQNRDFGTRCINCGYDLAGLGAGVRCPECAEDKA